MSIPIDAVRRSPAVGLALGWWGEIKTNRRSAAGLLLIVGLLAAYGAILLHGAVAAKRAEYARELARRQRIEAVAAERDWPARAASSAQLRRALEARLWTAESDGVARADLQDRIGNIAREIGLPVTQIRIELVRPKSLPDDFRQVTATIAAQPSEASLLALLGRVEQTPDLMVVDRLTIREQPDASLEIVLVGYARIAPQPGPAARKEATR